MLYVPSLTCMYICILCVCVYVSVYVCIVYVYRLGGAYISIVVYDVYENIDREHY